MPFISLQQVGGQLLSPQILQGVNASDQGCPVEAEARLPESPTEASTCPHFSQKGGRWETVHSSGFKGAMNPKAGERGRRAQRQCLHRNPHPALDGVHRPSVLPPPQQQALLGRVEGWLPVLYGGGEKAAKYQACQRTQGPRGREAHPSAGRGLRFWEGGALPQPGLCHTQEGPSLLHLPAFRHGRRCPPTAKPAGEASARPFEQHPCPGHSQGAPKMRLAGPGKGPESPREVAT